MTTPTRNAQYQVPSTVTLDQSSVGTGHKFVTLDGPLWTFGRIEPEGRPARHYDHYRIDVRLQPSRRIGVRWGIGLVAAGRREWRGAASVGRLNYDWTGDRLELLIGTRVLRVRRCRATVTDR